MWRQSLADNSLTLQTTKQAGASARPVRPAINEETTMKRNNLTRLWLAALLLVGLGAFRQVHADPVFGANLIVNGNGEAGSASPSGMTSVTIPGWTVTAGSPTVVAYGTAGGFPTATDPGPANRGSNFFAGGQNSALSSIAQTIDLSGGATQIDAGGVTFTLSGSFGGFATHNDNAMLVATFIRPGGTDVSFNLGGVLSADRGNVTGLIAQSLTNLIPVGARSVVLTLVFTRTNPTYNDGYADNLSLSLAPVPEPGTLALLGTGLAAAALRLRRRRRA
jgi:hypothetical protein